MGKKMDRRIEYTRLDSEDVETEQTSANERLLKITEFLDRLPHDLLFDIFSHLTPIEVFHLYRNSGKEEYLVLSDEVFRELCVKNKVPEIYNLYNWKATFLQFLNCAIQSSTFTNPYDFNVELYNAISTGVRRFEFLIYYYDNYGDVGTTPMGTDLMPTINGIMNLKNRVTTVALGNVNIKAMLNRDDVTQQCYTTQLTVHPASPSATLGHGLHYSTKMFLDKDLKFYYIGDGSSDQHAGPSVYCKDFSNFESTPVLLFTIDGGSAICLTVHDGYLYVVFEQAFRDLVLYKYDLAKNEGEEYISDTLVKAERLQVMGEKLLFLYKQGISVFSFPEDQPGVFKMTDTIFSGCRPHILNDDVILYSSEILNEEGSEVWVQALIRRERGRMIKDVARGLTRCTISVLSPYMFNIISETKRIIVYYEEINRKFLVLHIENRKSEHSSMTLSSIFKRFL